MPWPSLLFEKCMSVGTGDTSRPMVLSHKATLWRHCYLVIYHYFLNISVASEMFSIVINLCNLIYDFIYNANTNTMTRCSCVCAEMFIDEVIWGKIEYLQ